MNNNLYNQEQRNIPMLSPAKTINTNESSQYHSISSITNTAPIDYTGYTGEKKTLEATYDINCECIDTNHFEVFYQNHMQSSDYLFSIIGYIK